MQQVLLQGVCLFFFVFFSPSAEMWAFFFFFFFFFLSLFIIYTPPHIVFTLFFYLSKKKSPPSPSDFPTKIEKKKMVTRPFSRYLWSSVMLAGPEVGDHFILNLYNKLIPHPKILKYWGFLQNFFVANIFSGCLHVFAKKKKKKKKKSRI